MKCSQYIQMLAVYVPTTLILKNFTVTQFASLHFKIKSPHINHVSSLHITTFHITSLIYT